MPPQVCTGQPGYEGFSRYLSAGLQVYQHTVRENTSEINRLQKKLETATSDEERRQIRYKNCKTLTATNIICAPRWANSKCWLPEPMRSPICCYLDSIKSIP